jgi:hypothetical protein
MEFNGETYEDGKLPCNRENMTKLVEALESGNYQQARGYLRVLNSDGTAKGYCCLGVACDISGVGHWFGRGYRVREHNTSAFALPPTTGLPLQVQEWLGVDDPFVRISSQHALCATTLNDNGWDFHQIAAQLRKVYLSD